MRIRTCRTCSAAELEIVTDLGNQPLANGLTKGSVITPKFPLELVRCTKCNLLQLSVNIEPKLMFLDYKWETGTSKTTIQHCEKLASRILDFFEGLQPRILEVGSNDATLLKEIRKRSTGELVGVEPSGSFSALYKDELLRLELVEDFFNEGTAKQIRQNYGEFDAIVARNVFSHVPDLLSAMSGVKKLLASNGLFFMEFHWAKVILEEIHYDSIYHEHTYYHTIRSLEDILDRFDLYPFDAFESPISGGSLVVVSSTRQLSKSKALKEFENREILSGVLTKEKWLVFQSMVKDNISAIQDFFMERSKNKIVAIGASARSSTILNAINLGTAQLSCIADNNPRKWGLHTPGTGIPICSFQDMLKENPESIIVFPFNFKEEIINQLKESDWHGEIFFPLPHPPQIITL